VSTISLNSLEQILKILFEKTGNYTVLAAPLGLGKPHRLLNAIYETVEKNTSAQLEIYTALSLTTPKASGDLEKRFLQPFLDRHFGPDFPNLLYAVAQRKNKLPTNIKVQEFYLQSGAYLQSSQAQQSYASLNYTHVARSVAEKNINVIVHKVAKSPDGLRLSLSCNPDLTFDLLDEIARLGKPRPLMIAEIDPHLPWLDGTAAVDADFFDHICELPAHAPPLFALPRQAVTDAEYAIGLRASALVKDGGTLQIGIGSLSDALCHALILRHTKNDSYLQILNALAPGYIESALVTNTGGTAPFIEGLYGASEMVNDGFMHLYKAGILKRRVIDDSAVMQREHDHCLDQNDKQRLLDEGHWLDGGFYLGSHDLYAWLRDLPEIEKRGIGMTRISHINELYGGNENLERLQRRDARFFNTCMMMTALGAATSDALENGRLVSGVGGQYNFVAMAHTLRDSRSILMFRAIREQAESLHSNVLWSYGHTTIPRHLRDIAITEYGVADLRGADDEHCIRAMLMLCDARFAPNVIDKAKRELKLDTHFETPVAWSSNRPESLSLALAPFREKHTLPDYPLGCDFTDVELRLVKALGWLKQETSSIWKKAWLLIQAMLYRGTVDQEAMNRMGYASLSTFADKLNYKVIAFALHRTKTATEE
jgi:acyl-CoA hydrolase